MLLRILGSQQLLFGDSMGWLSPQIVPQQPPSGAIPEKWSVPEMSITTFSTCGSYGATTPYHRCRHHDDPPRYLELHSLPEQYPAVNGALWQRNRDGARVLLLTNIAGCPQQVEITLPQDGPLTLSGDMNETVIFHGGRAHLTLPPYSVVAARL